MSITIEGGFYEIKDHWAYCGGSCCCDTYYESLLMKTFFKIVLMVVVVLVLLGAAQTIFKFRVGELLGNLLGGTKLESVRVNVGQETVTPVFEVVSLEISYPKNLTIIEASKNEWWRLNIGTVFVLVEYDTYIKLGVRNPHSIKMERIDNTIYVDESTIVIELLDTKINNYHHIRTFYSNAFMINNDAEKFIFDSLNLMESELINKLKENGQANFENAKRNFMENYRLLCKSMGLEVIWR